MPWCFLSELFNIYKLIWEDRHYLLILIISSQDHGLSSRMVESISEPTKMSYFLSSEITCEVDLRCSAVFAVVHGVSSTKSSSCKLFLLSISFISCSLAAFWRSCSVSTLPSSFSALPQLVFVFMISLALSFSHRVDQGC